MEDHEKLDLTKLILKIEAFCIFEAEKNSRRDRAEYAKPLFL